MCFPYAVEVEEEGARGTGGAGVRPQDAGATARGVQERGHGADAAQGQLKT